MHIISCLHYYLFSPLFTFVELCFCSPIVCKSMPFKIKYPISQNTANHFMQQVSYTAIFFFLLWIEQSVWKGRGGRQFLKPSVQLSGVIWKVSDLTNSEDVFCYKWFTSLGWVYGYACDFHKTFLTCRFYIKVPLLLFLMFFSLGKMVLIKNFPASKFRTLFRLRIAQYCSYYRL